MFIFIPRLESFGVLAVSEEIFVLAVKLKPRFPAVWHQQSANKNLSLYYLNSTVLYFLLDSFKKNNCETLDLLLWKKLQTGICVGKLI